MVGHRQATARFKWYAGDAAGAELLANDVLASGERLIDVLGGETSRVDDVVFDMVVDSRRPRQVGGFEVHRDLKWLVVDRDQLRPALRHVKALRQNHRDVLADEPHLVARQRVTAVQLITREVDLGDDRLDKPSHVFAGKHRQHAVELQRLAGVDANDASVGVGAQHEAEVNGIALNRQIVDETAFTA